MRSVAAKQSDGEQQSQRPWWMNRSVQIVGVAALAGALVASVLLARRSRR
jgi:hypothetical protein